MGNHYIPQHYLDGFTAKESGRFWVYEKGTERAFRTQPKSVANVNELYPSPLERMLANEIENPGNDVLDKIRGRKQISQDDKYAFARYMTAMWKRVPATRTRILNMVLKLARDYTGQVDSLFSDEIARDQQNAEFLRRRRDEIQAVVTKFATDPPERLWHDNIAPERTPQIVDALSRMTWTFLVTNERFAFLTCDNPFFIFTDMGIGKPESEVSFPIEGAITLWGTWRTDLPQSYVNVGSSVVKEMNRRTASNAVRFVFHGEHERWVTTFLNKDFWSLNRLDLILRK